MSSFKVVYSEQGYKSSICRLRQNEPSHNDSLKNPSRYLESYSGRMICSASQTFLTRILLEALRNSEGKHMKI